MSSITFNIAISGVQIDHSVTLKQIIQKRLEYIRYRRQVPKSDVMLEYIGYEPITPDNTLFIADLSAETPENSQLSTYSFDNVSIHTVKNLVVPTRNILITNKKRTKENGIVVPFFYSHKLPDNTVNVSVHKITNTGREAISNGLYTFTSGTDYVFSDFINKFNEVSGQYQIYFVTSIDTNGNSSVDIWNGQPAFHEATFDDIDPDTGWLYFTSNAYVLNQSGNYWHISFPQIDTYFIKGQQNSRIQVLEPALQTSSDPWFIEVTNGSFAANINGTNYNYSVPEYEEQNFGPSKPYMLTTWESALKINKKTIKLQREDVYINANEYMHLELIFLDEQKNILYALTTDPTKAGSKYSDTDIEYIIDKIDSIDNYGGIISLVDFIIKDSYEIHATYYYKANTYIFTDYNLNPLYNEDILDYMFVVYIVPNVPDGDNAIYYLLVKNNIIYYCSQTGNPIPNLSQYNKDGTINVNSVIGWQYEGASGSGATSFRGVYPQYLILAEITGLVPDRPTGGKNKIARTS